jgi:hypothetical protein
MLRQTTQSSLFSDQLEHKLKQTLMNRLLPHLAYKHLDTIAETKEFLIKYV